MNVKRRIGYFSLLTVFLLSLYFAFTLNSDAKNITAKIGVLLTVKQAIGPGVEDYLTKNLHWAQQHKAAIIIIKLDTPGGLDTATREIVRQILASPVPVITYVAPSGARAASAGTYILLASHIAAMAPGTNVGAATPINLGGNTSSPKHLSTEEQKMENDAAAYLRSLAQLRGRNIAWVEKSVRESASLSANEALRLKVIDFIAPDINSLLQQANGKVVLVQGIQRSLNLSGLSIINQVPGARSQFLSIITDPNIAYFLLLAGICGLFFEFFNPGFVLPGVVGLISLLIALYALQLLPINYAALALIIFGVLFLLAEIFFPSGVLAVGGLTAFVFGSILLLEPSVPGFEIALSLIIGITIFLTIFFW